MNRRRRGGAAALANLSVSCLSYRCYNLCVDSMLRHENWGLEYPLGGHGIGGDVPSSARCMASGEQHRGVVSSVLFFGLQQVLSLLTFRARSKFDICVNNSNIFA
jgi:hypothetical protein